MDLIGEDRLYGGERDLYVDMIPTSCWFKNARSNIATKDWKRLREHVLSRTNYTCECCGVRSHKLDVHERWNYNTATRTQKLVRLIAICQLCHMVTHFGLAEMLSMAYKIKKHLCDVCQMDEDECEDHIEIATITWEKRNKYQWSLDLSILTDSGIDVKR